MGIVSAGIVVVAGAGIMLGPVMPATVVAMVPAGIVTAASVHAGSVLLVGGIAFVIFAPGAYCSNSCQRDAQKIVKSFNSLKVRVESMREFLQRTDLLCRGYTNNVQQAQDILQQAGQQYERNTFLTILWKIEQQAEQLKSTLDEMLRKENKRANNFLANENLYAEMAS